VAINRRKKEEGRRKREEGRRKRDERALQDLSCESFLNS